MYIVTGFYTKGTSYERLSRAMIKSVEKYDLKHWVQGYKEKATWVENCAMKPVHVLAALKKFPKNDIVQLDCDAEIVAKPVLFDTLTCDFAANYRKGRLQSGTLFFKNNARSIALVEKWVELQEKKQDVWDQIVLEQALKECPFVIKEELPSSYTHILGTTPGDKVIIHKQESRRYKNNKIKKEGKMIIEGQRVRVADNGTMHLVRPHRLAEEKLDKMFIRQNKKQRMWLPYPAAKADLRHLRPMFQGKMVYVVGKGPSLDLLTSKHFPDRDSVIMCINESIHKIQGLGLENQLFVFQHDKPLGNACIPKEVGPVMVTSYMVGNLDYPKQYYYNPFNYKATDKVITVQMAISVAQELGAKNFEFYAFDSVAGDFGYAECIGYPSSKAGDPQRFKSHRTMIERYLKVPFRFYAYNDLQNFEPLS